MEHQTRITAGRDGFEDTATVRWQHRSETWTAVVWVYGHDDAIAVGGTALCEHPSIESLLGEMERHGFNTGALDEDSQAALRALGEQQRAACGDARIMAVAGDGELWLEMSTPSGRSVPVAGIAATADPGEAADIMLRRCWGRPVAPMVAQLFAAEVLDAASGSYGLEVGAVLAWLRNGQVPDMATLARLTTHEPTGGQR